MRNRAQDVLRVFGWITPSKLPDLNSGASMWSAVEIQTITLSRTGSDEPWGGAELTSASRPDIDLNRASGARPPHSFNKTH